MDVSCYLFIPWKGSRAVELFFDSFVWGLFERVIQRAHESFSGRGSSPVMIVWGFARNAGSMLHRQTDYKGGFHNTPDNNNNSIKISINFDSQARRGGICTGIVCLIELKRFDLI